MNNCPIGVFDSGVGGLSVFSQLLKLLPDENYIYFGDTINLPYGNKSKEELISITKNIFDFFESKNVKAVVMACNTTSAVTYEELKDKYNFKIYPIVQNASKQIAYENYSKIGVFATKNTINSHAYKREIEKYSPKTQVYEIACEKWVDIVESQSQNDIDSINDIKNHLDKMMENSVDKIILGCTHYPYLLDILKRYVPESLFINPAKYFAKYIADDINNSNNQNVESTTKPVFFVTSNPNQFISSAKLFYDVKNVNEISLVKTKIKL